MELEYQQKNVKKLSDLVVIKNGMSILPSRERRKYFLLSIKGNDRYKALLKRRTELNVSYTDITGKKKI